MHSATSVVEMSPFLADRIGELKSWDDIKLLRVTVDRLQKWWRPGLICIGDSAHAMSPIGGVGINVAVQDAVAAANRLAAPLRAGKVTDADLQAIQQRRMLPVRFTQWLQLTIQKRIITRVLASQQRPKPPLLLQAVQRVSGSAAHSGAAARARHPPRAHPHAGGGATRPSRAFAVRSWRERGFRRAVLRPRRHCRAACRRCRADDRTRPRRGEAASVGCRVRPVPTRRQRLTRSPRAVKPLEHDVDQLTIGLQIGAAFVGDGVELFRAFGCSGDVARFLQIGQRRIDDAGARRVPVRRFLFEQLDDLIAVARRLGDQRQREKAKVALRQHPPRAHEVFAACRQSRRRAGRRSRQTCRGDGGVPRPSGRRDVRPDVQNVRALDLSP